MAVQLADAQVLAADPVAVPLLLRVDLLPSIRSQLINFLR